MVALFHELEEDVGLLGFDVQIPQLIDRQNVDVGERAQEPAGGAIGEGGVHLVEQILRFDKERAVAVLHGLEHERAHESGFADTGFTDEDEVLGLGDEGELSKGADLTLFDAGLDLEGEGFQGPGFGQLRALEPCGKGCLLTGLPLGTQQLGDEGYDGRAIALGGGEIFVEVSGDRLELQIDQELLEILIHRVHPAVSIRKA